MMTLPDRFWAKVSQGPNCWTWTGAVDSWGYGQYRCAVEGRQIPAHRASYQHFCGPIPTGLNVLHVCDNRRCVTPLHLFVGTQAANVRDMSLKGRNKGSATGVTHRLGNGTHCGYGHRLTPDNVYLRTRDDTRECRECRRIFRKRHRTDHPREGRASESALSPGALPPAVGLPLPAMVTQGCETRMGQGCPSQGSKPTRTAVGRRHRS